MKKKTFAILFYVKRIKLLRNGEAPIFVRITVDAVRSEMSIQRSISLSDWIEKKGCAKPTNVKNRELNHYLEHIRYRLYEIQKELQKLYNCYFPKKHYLCHELFETMEKRSRAKQSAHFHIVTH